MSESNKSAFFEWVKAGILAIILFFFIHTFLFSDYGVKGISMRPTLEDGDRLIVNQIGYEFGDISRFDVIIFHAGGDEDYVKRVIGLPGDTIQYKDDRLFINGEICPEPYVHHEEQHLPGLKETGDFTLSELTGVEKVPADSLFVMGDNRLNSLDSRHFGFVSIDDVVGKVSVRYWPLEKFDIKF
ncbi:MAG: signal peptidase I [Bacillus sp. (in: firmicutes)]